MNNIEVYIVVEGQTEQTFVRDVLGPYMADKGIYLYPALIGKPGHKGGCIHFDRARGDIGKFLKQRNGTYVSTMFDYFGIDADWPGKRDAQQRIQQGVFLCAMEQAEILEKAMCIEIEKFFGANAKSRFIPYIEMHEFEALLFSDAGILAEKIEVDISEILKILKQYDGPEEINDDPAKAPAKQLAALTTGYRKVAYGKAISEAIGIQNIRAQCAHFNDWLIRIEQLQAIAD